MFETIRCFSWAHSYIGACSVLFVESYNQNLFGLFWDTIFSFFCSSVFLRLYYRQNWFQFKVQKNVSPFNMKMSAKAHNILAFEYELVVFKALNKCF